MQWVSKQREARKVKCEVPVVLEEAEQKALWMWAVKSIKQTRTLLVLLQRLCVRDFFFCSIVSKLAEEHWWTCPVQRLRHSSRDTDGQVQASQSWQNLLSEDLQARGHEREISRSLMAGKQFFAWAYLEGDSRRRGYWHDSEPSDQGCHSAGGGGLKKGPTTMRIRCLTSEASWDDACVLTYTPGVCYLRLASSSWTCSALYLLAAYGWPLCCCSPPAFCLGLS